MEEKTVRIVFMGNGGWWAKLYGTQLAKERGPYPYNTMERGPYPFKWMARLAFPIARWTFK